MLEGSSNVKAIQTGFVPPLFALLALANWEESPEKALDALHFLVQDCNVLRVT